MNPAENGFIEGFSDRAARQHEVVQSTMNAQMVDVGAETLPIAGYVVDVEHGIGVVEIGSPGATAHRACRIHEQDGNTDIGALLHIHMCLVDGSEPCRIHIGGIFEFPASVVIPLAVIAAQKALRIGIAIAFRHLYVAEHRRDKRNERHSHILEKRRKVHVEERAVEDEPAYREAVSPTLRHVVGGDKSACGVSHEQDGGVSIANGDGHHRVDFGEIFRQVSHLKPHLPGKQRATILAQIHGIEIEAGINKFAVIETENHGKIYACEVNGKGDYFLFDDANVPSLLSAPYLGFCDCEDEIYRNTRSFILSKDNPYYYEGKFAKGVGSPHTPEGYIWHIALSMQGLTSNSPDEIREILHMLETTDGGKGYMHEGFDANNPKKFTRSWFSWSCSLFAELVEKAVNENII